MIESKMGSFAAVYVSDFPFEINSSVILPSLRKTEIDFTEQGEKRNQRFYAWKLLEIALTDMFGDSSRIQAVRRVDNKWVADNFSFSISHSGNAVAVAISDCAVGVDIEKFERSRFNYKLANKILTLTEINQYYNLPQTDRELFLIEMWTVKEALFKLSNERFFSPASINGDVAERLKCFIKIKTTQFALSSVTSFERNFKVVCLNNCNLDVS